MVGEFIGSFGCFIKVSWQRASLGKPVTVLGMVILISLRVFVLLSHIFLFQTMSYLLYIHLHIPILSAKCFLGYLDIWTCIHRIITCFHVFSHSLRCIYSYVIVCLCFLIFSSFFLVFFEVFLGQQVVGAQESLPSLGPSEPNSPERRACGSWPWTQTSERRLSRERES